jgi:predicted metalloprotease
VPEASAATRAPQSADGTGGDAFLRGVFEDVQETWPREFEAAGVDYTRFFAVLSRAAGVRLGDFAQAFVVGHEVGHHVQAVLGPLQRLHEADQRDPAGENGDAGRVRHVRGVSPTTFG